MHLSIFALKQPQSCIGLCIFILCLFSLPINVFSSSHQRRGQCCGGVCDDESSTSDGPTIDQSPGIGIEFEAGNLRFKSEGCDKPSTDMLKRALVGGRQGTNWKLTADTTINEAGVLTAEYILDGTQIKIGSNMVAPAAAAVSHDITTWNPVDGVQVDIVGSTCPNPWQIPETVDVDTLLWAPQITAPVPLEALADYFAGALNGGTSVLYGTRNPGRNVVSVTRDFFQTAPNGITSDSVKADVLGFFSLIISYVKVAKVEDEDMSLKELLGIMPRTDFTHIFSQVKETVPSPLWNIVTVLACYRNAGSGVAIDPTFCTGTLQAPVSNGHINTLKFGASSSDGKSDSCTVREWIDSIEAGTSPDRLSQIDQVIDSSIGGFKGATERVLDTNRLVPLFEFRRLTGVTAGSMQDFAVRAEQAIIAYHHAYPNAPRLIKRRPDSKHSHIKRQDACPSILANMTASTTASTTASIMASDPPCIHYGDSQDTNVCVCTNNATISPATGSNPCPWPTLPPQALETSTTHLPTTQAPQYKFTTTMDDGEVDEYQSVTYGNYGGYRETFGAGSKAIIVATSAKPAVTVEVGKKGENIGTLNPTALYTSVSNALEKICPTVTGSGPGSCADTTQVIKPIDYLDSDETLSRAGELDVSVLYSVYKDNKMRTAMINAAAGTARDAASKNCNATHYEACGVHGCDPATITLCSTTQFAGVHVNDGTQLLAPWSLNAEFDFKASSDSLFDCEFALEAINIGLDIIAPEFVIEDTAVIDELIALCTDVMSHGSG